jgi:hypothetical protein
VAPGNRLGGVPSVRGTKWPEHASCLRSPQAVRAAACWRTTAMREPVHGRDIRILADDARSRAGSRHGGARHRVETSSRLGLVQPSVAVTRCEPTRGPVTTFAPQTVFVGSIPDVLHWSSSGVRPPLDFVAETLVGSAACLSSRAVTPRQALVDFRPSASSRPGRHRPHRPLGVQRSRKPGNPIERQRLLDVGLRQYAAFADAAIGLPGNCAQDSPAG